MILLFELLEPGIAVHLDMAIRTSDRSREESSFLSNGTVCQWETLPLMISRPVRQGSLDVRKFAFGSFDRRSAAIFREKILLLLSQNLGNSTRRTTFSYRATFKSENTTDLLSTPNIAIFANQRPDFITVNILYLPPISVCLTVGLSS